MPPGRRDVEVETRAAANHAEASLRAGGPGAKDPVRLVDALDGLVGEPDEQIAIDEARARRGAARLDGLDLDGGRAEPVVIREPPTPSTRPAVSSSSSLLGGRSGTTSPLTRSPRA